MARIALANKIVLITGGSLGIGRETAKAFAKQGARIILTYHKHQAEAQAAVQECESLGAPVALAVQLDLTDEASIAKTAQEHTTTFGQIDVLINNAGAIIYKNMAEMSFKEIDVVLQANLTGLIKLTRACLPCIKEAIINVGSGAGKTGYGGMAVYCASKFGVRGFTQGLAAEYPKLNIYCVNPGTTATGMTGFKGTPPEKVADVIVKAAQGEYNIPNGGDVDVWEMAD